MGNLEEGDRVRVSDDYLGAWVHRGGHREDEPVPDGLDEVGRVVQLPPPGDAWYGFALVEFPGGTRNIPTAALIPVTGPGRASTT